MMYNFSGWKKQSTLRPTVLLQRQCQTLNVLLYYCLEQQATINLRLLSFTVAEDVAEVDK